MKLIIDIPEEEYERIKDIPNDYKLLIHKAVANGTPLDDVKAEMESLIDWHDCPIELDNGNDSWYCQAVNQCLEIIDKHISGKENNADIKADI